MAGQKTLLTCYSEYSHSTVTPKRLVEAAAAAGYTSLALTDRGNMTGAVKFYKAAKAAGINPIIGLDLRIHDDVREGRVVLLAQNSAGYHNLMRLLSKANMAADADDEDPVAELGWLGDFSEGVIALAGGLEGLGWRASQGEHGALASKKVLEALKKAYGSRLGLRLQKVGADGEAAYNQWAVGVAAHMGIPPVATNPISMVDKDDFRLNNIRKAIADKTSLLEMEFKDITNGTPHQLLSTPQAMGDIFGEIPCAVTNANAIGRHCSLEIEFGNYQLPKFPVPDGMSEADLLARNAREGLERRLRELFGDDEALIARRRAPYDERLGKELGIIESMGFPGYFLIVADFINWAKRNDIPVGPGRGSGAGSLVAYSIRITDLDPLEYGLMFERFLNPERVSMPDFDVDFCMNKRDLVIRYVADKFGHDRVAQIATRGTMAAKSALNDAARVMGLSFRLAQALSKLVPNTPGATLEDAEQESQFLAMIKAVATESGRPMDSIMNLWETAKALSGLYRNMGKHAGGVVIGSLPLEETTPIKPSDVGHEGFIGSITGYDKDDVEEVGLVKFDFLGLSNLTILDWALKAVNKRREKQGLPCIRNRDIPLDDDETFRLLREGRTTSVFQLTSAGMRKLIKELRPDRFEDIIALVALYRPGPLQSGMVTDFINRKHGRAKVEYPHPSLERILEPTYGVILYQEQVMQIAQELSGYSLGGADLLRRAMGKKKPEIMAKERANFVNGAVENGVDQETAAHIFDLVEMFAGYGFNKSHSAGYALITMQTAWLKAHYPSEFMAAVLSSEQGNTDKIVVAMHETREMGLQVLAPSINHSGKMFEALDDGRILYGLDAIKGVGEKIIGRLIEERQSKGPFRGLYDLCRRCNPNKREVEALISAGALDEFDENRASLSASLPEIQKVARADAKKEQPGLFDATDDQGPDYVRVPEWTADRRLAEEKRVLGLYLSGHPMDTYRQERALLEHVEHIRDALESANAAVVSDNAQGKEAFRGRNVELCGYIRDIATVEARRGDRYTRMDIDDGTGVMRVMVPARLHAEKNHILAEGGAVVVRGTLRKSAKYGTCRVVSREVLDMDELRIRYAKAVDVNMGDQAGDGQAWRILWEVVGGHGEGGSCPVRVRDSQGRVMDEDTQALPKILPTRDALQSLRELFGEKAVTVDYGAGIAPAPIDRRSAAEKIRQRQEAGRQNREQRWGRTLQLIEEAKAAMNM